MAWVKTINVESANEKLAEVYERVRKRSGIMPNIASLQSLRPETMERGFDLYCQLMDAPTGITKRERILIATVISKVNGCFY
jgi:alkylhydroperoxidase family enzyme